MPGYGTAAVLSNTGTATGVAVSLPGLNTVGTTSAGTLPVGAASAAQALADDGNGSKGCVLNLGLQIIPVAAATPADAGILVGRHYG